MDARSWHSSANRYYAFGGEKLDLLRRISKTPPPPSTRSSRSPPTATYKRKSAPTSPMFGSPALPRSSLLHRISPKGYSPQSRPARDLPPSSPVLRDFLDSHLDKEEEEQVIRVLDNNQELVYQRDFGLDERLDRDGGLHESRDSSPAKKRKLVHPSQPANDFASQSPPMQAKPNQKHKHTRSKSRSPPRSQSNTTSPSEKQPPASQPGVDWSSGSSNLGGSSFGKRPGLTFGFAGYGYDTSAEVNTTRKANLHDRGEATPSPEPPQDDTRGSRSLRARSDLYEPSPPLTSAAAQDRSNQAREPSKEGGKKLGGTSSFRRFGSRRPIFDPELEVPLGGGEDHDPGHEAAHGRETAEIDTFTSSAFPPTLPPQSKDLPMKFPPLRTPNRKDLQGSAVPSESVASSRSPTPPPGSRTPPRAEVAEKGIKSMEQHAEDLLQDIQKEFLSKTEARISSGREGIISRFSTEGDASMSLRDNFEPLRVHSTSILDGMSPLAGTRFISPFSDIEHHDISFDALSISTHTPRSIAGNLPASIVRSTSSPTSDPDSNDTLLEVDPDVDQMTKQALGDLIVYSLKLNHGLDAKEGLENNDVFRRALNHEVDKNAREFLKLATKLARRMDSMREPRENEHLECLPVSDDPEGNEEPPEEDTRRVDPDVEMDSVPSGVPQSDSEEYRAEPNDEPADEQKPDVEPTDGHAERVDHVDDVEPADEGDYEESGLEIPGVWCARTGKDRTDTIQEHVEVSEVLAARVRKWAKKNGGSGE